MAEEVKGVKIVEEAPLDKPVEKVDSDAGAELDYATTLTALQAEKEARVKAEAEKENYKKGLLKAKGKLPDEDEPEDIDKLVEAKVNEYLKANHPNLVNSVDTELEGLTSNPAEKDLIKWHYENSIVKSGNVRDDLENAKLLANKGKLLKVDREKKVALDNRAQLSRGTGAGDNDSKGDVSNDFWTKEQLQFFEKRSKEIGVKIDPTKVKENLLKYRNRIK